MRSFARPPARIGYARVSTTDQTLNLQRDAFKAVGCAKSFTDRGLSGSLASRPGLDRALAALRPGDTLIVWKLDRRGRSLAHLVQTIAALSESGINLRSLSDPIDTQSPGGRLVLHIMGAIAEFEGALVVERTRAGLEAAQRRSTRCRSVILPPESLHIRDRAAAAGMALPSVTGRLGYSFVAARSKTQV
jgi:DNA invertase Pin-like site-specific DNA recombinase